MPELNWQVLMIIMKLLWWIECQIEKVQISKRKTILLYNFNSEYHFYSFTCFQRSWNKFPFEHLYFSDILFSIYFHLNDLKIKNFPWESSIFQEAPEVVSNFWVFIISPPCCYFLYFKAKKLDFDNEKNLKTVLMKSNLLMLDIISEKKLKSVHNGKTSHNNCYHKESKNDSYKVHWFEFVHLDFLRAFD